MGHLKEDWFYKKRCIDWNYIHHEALRLRDMLWTTVWNTLH